MTIVVSPQAREDLDKAYQRIARDNPGAADGLLARLIEVIGMPASGQVEGPEVRFLVGMQDLTPGVRSASTVIIDLKTKEP